MFSFVEFLWFCLGIMIGIAGFLGYIIFSAIVFDNFGIIWWAVYMVLAAPVLLFIWAIAHDIIDTYS
jgi:hypothetical protein